VAGIGVALAKLAPPGVAEFTARFALSLSQTREDVPGKIARPSQETIPFLPAVFLAWMLVLCIGLLGTDR
jgi:hypothetical protein